MAMINPGVNGATGGEASVEFENDMSFGLTSDIAKQVGIEADWVAMKKITVEVDFGSGAAPS